MYNNAACRAPLSNTTPNLLALKLHLLDLKRSIQQARLLLGVTGLETSGHTGTWVTTGVHDVLPVVVLCLVEKGLNARLREGPSTSVQRLLLTPDDGLRVGVHIEVLLELLPWEGVQLLNAGDGGVLDLLAGTVLVESGVDLTCAEDDTLDLVWVVDGVAVFWVWDDPLELGILGELLNWRSGKWMAEKVLGEEEDES